VGTPGTRFLITELGNREIDAKLYLYDFPRGTLLPREVHVGPSQSTHTITSLSYVCAQIPVSVEGDT
jgi:hypothetical protein